MANSESKDFLNYMIYHGGNKNRRFQINQSDPRSFIPRDFFSLSDG